MRANLDGHVQVAVRPAPWSGLALALERDALAVVDPGRDADHHLSLLADPSVPAADGARRGDDPSLAVAARAGDDVDHLAQDRLRDPALLAAAVALGARLRLGTRLAAGTIAVRAGHQRRERELLRDAEDGFRELDGQVVAEVGTGHHPRAASRAGRVPAEEGVEDVAERAEPATEALESAGRRTLDAGVPEHVVRRAPLAIGEHPVRLVQLLEARLGPVIRVDVGMVPLREAPERTLDLGVVGIAADAQDLVVVTLHGHGGQDHTNWHSTTSECQPVGIRPAPNSCQ